MTKEQAIKLAQKDAIQHNAPLVVVCAPIEEGEFAEGPDDVFGYCPPEAKGTLYRYGEIVANVAANGEVTEVAKGEAQAQELAQQISELSEHYNTGHLNCPSGHCSAD